MALSPGYPEFPLGTTAPFGVRTFLTGLKPERPCIRPATIYISQAQPVTAKAASIINKIFPIPDQKASREKPGSFWVMAEDFWVERRNLLEKSRNVQPSVCNISRRYERTPYLAQNQAAFSSMPWFAKASARLFCSRGTWAIDQCFSSPSRAFTSSKRGFNAAFLTLYCP